MRLIFAFFALVATSSQSFACFTMTRYFDGAFELADQCAFQEAGGILPVNAGPVFETDNGLFAQQVVAFQGCYWQRYMLVVDCEAMQVIMLPQAGQAEIELEPLNVRPEWPEFLTFDDKRDVVSLTRVYEKLWSSHEGTVDFFAKLEPHNSQPDPFCACNLPKGRAE